MGGVFMAHGTIFKENYTSEEPTHNVDVKPLICWVLRISCDSQMDGKLKSMKQFVKYPDKEIKIDRYSNYFKSNYYFIFYVGFMYFLSVFSVIFISFCNLYRIKHEIWVYNLWLNLIWRLMVLFFFVQKNVLQDAYV